MSAISKKELQKRKNELSKLAREELAKMEIMRFRLDPDNIIKLCEIAEKKRKRVGTMLRQWVLERIELETHIEPSKLKAYAKNTYSTILRRLEYLEAEVKRLSHSR